MWLFKSIIQNLLFTNILSCRSKEFSQYILELVTSLRWLTKLMASLVVPKDHSTMWEFYQLWIEKTWNQMQELHFIDPHNLLSTFFQLTPMHPSKWWRWPRNLMSHMQILEVWIFRSKKSRKLLSFHLLIQSCIHKSVLTHQEVSFFMDHQVQKPLHVQNNLFYISHFILSN